MTKSIDDYQTILDKVDQLSLKIFNKILPGNVEYRRYVIAVLFTPIFIAYYIIVSYQVGEGDLIADNLFTWSMFIFSVTFLLIAENIIGDNIRDSIKETAKSFNLDEDYLKDNYLKWIFSRWRTISGVVFSGIATLLGLLLFLNEPFAGHESLIIKVSNIVLFALLSFIFGEAALGSIFTMYKEFRLLEDLSDRMELMNEHHQSTLKKVTSWGIQISLLLSIIASGVFLALLTNPHFSEFYLQLPFGWGRIENEVIRALTFIFIALVLLLIVFLFVTPIYAISSNINSKKESELSTISDNYSDIHTEVLQSLQTESMDPELSVKMDYLEALSIMENKVKKVSTIPYDVRGLTGVSQAILIPILSFLGRNIDFYSLLGLN